MQDRLRLNRHGKTAFMMFHMMCKKQCPEGPSTTMFMNRTSRSLLQPMVTANISGQCINDFVFSRLHVSSQYVLVVADCAAAAAAATTDVLASDNLFFSMNT